MRLPYQMKDRVVIYPIVQVMVLSEYPRRDNGEARQYKQHARLMQSRHGKHNQHCY